MLAALDGHDSTVELLLDRGADVEAPDDVRTCPDPPQAQWSVSWRQLLAGCDRAQYCTHAGNEPQADSAGTRRAVRTFRFGVAGSEVVWRLRVAGNAAWRRPGGGPARGAWWRSVWLGLECVDGSLAGAGVAAVGGCVGWNGPLGEVWHGWRL